jgi:hypothetical protein
LRLRRLRKNTIRAIGIIAFSIFFFFSFLVYPRSYEVQFHTIKLHKKLDYALLKKIGASKIIFRVFQDEEEDGGLYFINSHFRTIEPALENLIEEFDFTKLDLCAWMITRKFNWITDPLMIDYRYENGDRKPIRKLDIFNPDVVRKIIDVYKELASHKIGFILIQDDLMFRYNEGFSSWGKALFSEAVQAPAVEKLMTQKDTDYYYSWNRIKMDQVNRVLKLIVENCKRVNSGIKVGINVYYETPVFESRAAAWYGHNLKEIMDTGVDFVYLMSYQRQIKDEMGLTEAANREFFTQIVEKAYRVCQEKLVVKIQVRDWKTSERIPVEEVREYLRLVPDKVERVCFTPLMPIDFDYLNEIINGPDKNVKEPEEGRGNAGK